MTDLDLDLAVPGVPRKIWLGPEERAALGPLANLRIRRPLLCSDAEDLARQIVQHVEESPGDIVATTRALVRAERAFELLVRHGFDQLEGFLPMLRASLDRIIRAVRRELVRRLMRDEIDPEKAEEILAVLQGQIDGGHWPGFETDIVEVERKLIAQKDV